MIQNDTGGGGIDGAIHTAAGPDLADEATKKGPCRTGDARITLGYNLYATRESCLVAGMCLGTGQIAVTIRIQVKVLQMSSTRSDPTCRAGMGW